MAPALHKTQSHTYADYLTWSGDVRYELIDGVAYAIAPAPLRAHQEILGEVFRQTANALEGKPCRPFIAASDVRLPHGSEADGMDVTCDVSINHVHLCDMDIGYFDPNCHLIPPLRSQRDREALCKGLAEGRINALCSDHTPVDDDGKQTPFSESEPGATGLELLLPLTLKWADRAGLSLLDGLARITSDAAKIVGITKAGHLSVGARGDVCVFDPDTHVTITRDSLRSQGKNTPFLGMELPGKVRYTLVEGQVMYEG